MASARVTTDARMASRSDSCSAYTMAARCEGQTAIRGSEPPEEPSAERTGRAGPRTPNPSSSSWSAIVSVTEACEWSAMAITACSRRNCSTPPAAFITRASCRSAWPIE